MKTRCLAHAAAGNSSPAQLLIPSHVVALAAPDSLVHPLVVQSLARRTQRGERVGMVIGHNCFALYTLARLARAGGGDPARRLDCIELSRAFTCYQLHRRILTLDAALLQRWRALYVLGLLDTFFDESIEYHQAAHLLNDVLTQLKRVTRTGLPVLITLSAPPKPGRESFLELVAASADEYWALAAPIVQTGGKARVHRASQASAQSQQRRRSLWDALCPPRRS